MQNLVKNTKVTRVSNAEAAATTDVNTTILDMSGYRGVMWIAEFGAITATAVTSIKAQQGAASDLSDAADLTGTSISIDDDEDN